ncbi:MAG: S1 family peptidase, partial [Chloroflexota bacterium]|nr:S1 family peptidase [Chloroflexota bacterium]
PGMVFVDDDESIGKIVVGVENANAARGVRAAMAAAGFATGTYEVIETEPIRQLATLRDVFRPVIGGVQIHFSMYVCTLGFNATHQSGERSFITNSHCTKTQGGTEGTVYYQPSSSTSGVIATEVDDPQYFKGGVCPRGKKCRYSDSSRALYDGGTNSSLGVIAKTDGINTGSLTVAGTINLTGEGSVGLGAYVNKIGRTTGWTRGRVTRTCVNTSVLGSSIMQLCQNFVDAGVDGGDSGSPVFDDSNVLVGILWGGSSDNASFVYSPLNQIEQELGNLTIK